uniref:Uncharacterized protein n=1 Tax=Parascaris equorum TaxID=6256 RepID=A0A914RJ42_PAREQ
MRQVLALEKLQHSTVVYFTQFSNVASISHIHHNKIIPKASAQQRHKDSNLDDENGEEMVEGGRRGRKQFNKR